MRSIGRIVATFLTCLLGMAWLLPTATAQPVDDWTFLVYLDGDNNLEAEGITDFLEMASIGSDSNVNVLVLFDRTPGYSSAYGDWTDTRRGRVDPNDVPDGAWGTSIGEANMGDPNTLVDFVEWGMQNFPAQRYAVVLWDHGNGWRGQPPDESPLFKSVCQDDTDGDTLVIREVRQALETIENDASRLDLVGFDACLMGMVEVAYEIREPADVMVGSEKTEPLDGWPYDTILGDLQVTPTMSAGSLGTVIVQRYWQSYSESETMSAVGLGWMSGLGQKIDALAYALMEDWNGETGACVGAAAEVMFRISDSVIAEAHGDDWPGSHGLAAYFPEDPNDFNALYNGNVILFAFDTRWDQFMLDFYASMGGSWVADARDQSQEYYVAGDYWHIDLYNFCLKLIEEAPGTVWVDFDYVGGFEYGTYYFPFNTLGEALGAASDGESICIMAGSASETPTIDMEVTLHAVGGSVTIGAP